MPRTLRLHENNKNPLTSSNDRAHIVSLHSKWILNQPIGCTVCPSKLFNFPIPAPNCWPSQFIGSKRTLTNASAHIYYSWWFLYLQDRLPVCIILLLLLRHGWCCGGGRRWRTIPDHGRIAHTHDCRHTHQRNGTLCTAHSRRLFFFEQGNIHLTRALSNA